METLAEDLLVEQSKKTDFTDGETEATSSSRSQTGDPVIVAQRFLQHRAASVQEEVSSTVVVSEGWASFSNDEDKLQQFLEELARAKVLTQAEVAQGLTGKTSNSTMSKLRKIREHRDVILHPKILPFLQAGYSVLYELILLYEALEETHECH
jgi:hypothetical protein